MERLSDGVWQIDCRGVNAYLVDDGERTLIDAGLPWSAGRIETAMDRAGFDGLDRILVTHYDLDHVGSLGAFDAPTYAREPDASHADWTARPSPWNRKGAFQRLTGRLARRPVEPPHRVIDDDRVGGFHVLAASGHTLGHTVYVHEDLGAAFLGDLVMGSDGSLTEPPRLLTANPAQNRASIRDVADRTPDFDVAAMGHGDPLAGGGATALDDLARATERR